MGPRASSDTEERTPAGCPRDAETFNTFYTFHKVYYNMHLITAARDASNRYEYPLLQYTIYNLGRE
jgi:hypothetical protein